MEQLSAFAGVWRKPALGTPVAGILLTALGGPALAAEPDARWTPSGGTGAAPGHRSQAGPLVTLLHVPSQAPAPGTPYSESRHQQAGRHTDAAPARE